VVDLRFFSWCGEDDACGFRTLWPAKRAHQALHHLITAGKTVLGNQVFPDRFANRRSKIP
jgi:hypothetical protein